MSKIRECRAKDGVMFCRSPRCPERIKFFSDLEVSHRAQDAADHIATVQLVLREQGFKAATVLGIDDLLPDMKLTRQVWSETDMKRLEAMLGDDNHIDGEIMDVPIKDIQTVRQSIVKLSALHHYLKHDDHKRRFGKGVFNKDNLPVIIRNGNQLAVVDGTHRFVTRSLMKDTHIRAVVADLI